MFDVFKSCMSSTVIAMLFLAFVMAGFIWILIAALKQKSFDKFVGKNPFFYLTLGLILLLTLIIAPIFYKTQLGKISEKLQHFELSGIIDSKQLIQEAEEFDIKFTFWEKVAVKEYFDKIYCESCTKNMISSKAIPDGELIIFGNDFYYKGGDWQKDAETGAITYYGKGLAWTKKRYNLLTENVTIKATISPGERVIADSKKPENFGFIMGITLNALNWPDKLADGVTLSVDSEFSTIRHNIYQARPSTLKWFNPEIIEVSKEYEILVEFNSKYFSLKAKELNSDADYKPILYREITDEDIKQYNIPMCCHIALFTYDMEGRTIPIKRTINSFEIVSEKIK